jgi:hypothetical protein
MGCEIVEDCRLQEKDIGSTVPLSPQVSFSPIAWRWERI